MSNNKENSILNYSKFIIRYYSALSYPPFNCTAVVPKPDSSVKPECSVGERGLQRIAGLPEPSGIDVHFQEIAEPDGADFGISGYGMITNL